MTDSKFWIKSIRFSVGKGLRLVAPFVSRVGRVVASSRPKKLWCGQWSERDLRRCFPSRYEKSELPLLVRVGIAHHALHASPSALLTGVARARRK